MPAGGGKRRGDDRGRRSHHSLARVGKCYYRSPDYHREQALFRNANLITSPISIFGIGILSCFMIADRLGVRCSAGGANRNRSHPARHHDLRVPAACSRFAGTGKRQGTEIKLFLKSRFRLEHNAQAFLPALRHHFGYREGRAIQPRSWGDEIHPSLPLLMSSGPEYPIEIRVPGGAGHCGSTTVSISTRWRARSIEKR